MDPPGGIGGSRLGRKHRRAPRLQRCVYDDFSGSRVIGVGLEGRTGPALYQRVPLPVQRSNFCRARVRFCGLCGGARFPRETGAVPGSLGDCKFFDFLSFSFYPQFKVRAIFFGRFHRQQGAPSLVPWEEVDRCPGMPVYRVGDA